MTAVCALVVANDLLHFSQSETDDNERYYRDTDDGHSGGGLSRDKRGGDGDDSD